MTRRYEHVYKKCLATLLAATFLLTPMFVGGCGGPSAEEITKESLRASEKITTFEYTMDSLQTFPRAPIVDGKASSREFSIESKGAIDQKTGNLEIETNLVEGVPVVARYIDGKTYVQLIGNWYEAPEDFQIQAASVQSALSVSQYLQYFKSLDKKGDTRVNNQDCYHLRAVPDMKELIELPGIADLLKDPATGRQIRTTDELLEMKATFDFYIRKSDKFMVKSAAVIEVRATEELIQLGYAGAGEFVKLQQSTVLSNFNKKLDLTVPADPQPWPQG